VKNLLVFFWLFSISYSAAALEQRLTSFRRFGALTTGTETADHFAEIIPQVLPGGDLTVSRVNAIESLHPYDFDDGRPVPRPALIDDLFYESLLLSDPVAESGRMYPLLAQALRVPDDLSHVIFEINPHARFQDGTPVTAADVLFSVEVLKKSSRALKDQFEEVVKSVTAGGSEVKFELTTTGQASRHAIMFLASIKIVKPNTTGAVEVGGIRVNFTPSGPYRMTRLGRSRLSLIIDPSYWGRDLSTRKGFFNFRAVDVAASPNEHSARLSVANDETNFFFESQPWAAPSTMALIKAKNAHIQHIEEDARSGSGNPSLSFNLDSPAVIDWRVRQAILLAFDFEEINRVFFGDTLRRPLSLLESGPLAPQGLPSNSVQALMDSCPIPQLGAFETYGHSQYAAIADKRVRLLTAMRLLQEAGYKLENGIIRRPLADGSYTPFILRLLVKENQMRSLFHFRTDLQRLGILVNITGVDGENFRALQSTGNFDLISTDEAFVDQYGWPNPHKLKLYGARNLPCLQNMLRTLEKEEAKSQAYRDNAEAIARVHQALHLNIFTGAPAKKNFFVDQRLNIPSKLSIEKIHMYGYWIEPTYPDQMPLYWPGGGCLDIGCLFGRGN